MDQACELCARTLPGLLWEDDFARVIRVAEQDFPGFCRVILRRHVKEMTDLPAAARERLMHVVFATEQALIQTMAPDKVNLASLGNMVAHVHWHVIPRFADDSHFPAPIWAESKRAVPARSAPSDQALLTALRRALTDI